MQRYLQILLLAVFLLTASIPSLYAQDSMQIELKGKTISAEIKNVPAGKVLQYLKEHNILWFQGDEPLLNKKISTSFENLSLTEGLRRILISFNHAMIFDKAGNLRGLVLVESGKEIKINNQAYDISLEDQTPPPKDSPNHPGYSNGKIVMPDEDKSDRKFSPADNPPTKEQLETKGPAAGKPPEDGPGTGKKPKVGPGDEKPKFDSPPME